ncbi:MAG: hypothetical protein RPR97_15095 [Colwellia sp.]
MSNNSSKTELLYMINELKESGDFENALRLQKVFLESITKDREAGRFNEDIELDRREKKAVSGAKSALTKSSSRR